MGTTGPAPVLLCIKSNIVVLSRGPKIRIYNFCNPISSRPKDSHRFESLWWTDRAKAIWHLIICSMRILHVYVCVSMCMYYICMSWRKTKRKRPPPLNLCKHTPIKLLITLRPISLPLSNLCSDLLLISLWWLWRHHKWMLSVLPPFVIESKGQRLFHLTKWQRHKIEMFPLRLSKQTIEQTVESLVNWHAMTLMWTTPPTFRKMHFWMACCSNLIINTNQY